MNNIYNIHEANPFCVRAVAEHRLLHAAYQKILQVLQDCPAESATAEKVAEVLHSIVVLRDQLTRHFALEEQGGYLEEATIRNPHLAPQADALLDQHGRLLEAANRLLAEATAGGSPRSVWKKLNIDYQRFAGCLRDHEAAEDALLQRAFNEDFGIEM